MANCQSCGAADGGKNGEVAWVAIHDCYLCEKCKAFGNTPSGDY